MAVPDLLRARLARRWVVTVEVVTPAPDDETSRARILTLASALRDDDRVGALTLTDRTTSPDADPIALASLVADRSGKAPLVHLAGKGRDARDVARALERCEAAGVGSVLLTGGDLAHRDPAGRAKDERSEAAGRAKDERSEAAGRAKDEPSEAAGRANNERSEAPERAGEAREPATSMDAIEMIRIAAARAPAIMRVGVVSLPRSVRGAVSWERAQAKRAAGADAFVAQVTWDLAEREMVADWQARLQAPILGAVMLLSRTRLAFLASHRIGGIHVPAALRRRLAGEPADDARRRVALDLVALRRLGYAGAHLSGLLTPSLVLAVLDRADDLDATLGDDWRAACP